MSDESGPATPARREGQESLGAAFAKQVRAPSTVVHMAGLGLVLSAAGMLLSAGVDMVVGGSEVGPLLASTATVGGVGVLAWRGTRVPPRVSAASAFAAVSWTWIVVSVAGAVPYVLAGTFPTLDDALFESVSGFTATGSTVLSPIEGTSRGLLFWRQLTQWYGGMGMIVLAVAVLPFLGVGGYELLQTEAPGEGADRLAPRVSETAKRLWLVYSAITGLVAVALAVTGLDLYDSVTHALTAVATGGFSPYNDSIAHFDSQIVELVVMGGMLLGAISFTLHWRFVRGDRRSYLRSAELRFFLAVLLAATAVITLLNIRDGMGAARALRDSAFNVVAMMTTTGFGTADFVAWVPATQLILLFLMVSGAMAGSTSGAVKLFRVQVMLGHARRELKRARVPRAVLPVKIGKEPISEAIVARIVGFVLLYFGIAVVGVVLLAVLGADLATAAGSVVTAMGGVGPGLGETGPASNFLPLARPGRGLLMVLMLLGRLEIFPMVLMFAAVTRPHRRARADGRRHRRGRRPRLPEPASSSRTAS